MTSEYIKVFDNFRQVSKDLLEVNKTADRNKKSLSGTNFYAGKFRPLELELLRCRTIIELSLGNIETLSNDDKKKISELMDTIHSSKTQYKARVEAIHEFERLYTGKILPTLQKPTLAMPKSEQVLPLAVVDNTRDYIKHIVIQFNGCYENGWYDACSVMMRKLIEILIISCYEYAQREAYIKGRDGNFPMLSELVDKFVADSGWTLGRETKKALPEIKSLGDRAAHTRRYLSTKADIDKLISGYRVTVDELLHLANLK